MKTQYLTVLLALICSAGLGPRASAQEGTIVATVPHDFVAAGRTLPAGTYRISRVDHVGDLQALLISSYETGASVFVRPTDFDNTQSGHFQLSFERAGDEYFSARLQPRLEHTRYRCRHRISNSPRWSNKVSLRLEGTESWKSKWTFWPGAHATAIAGQNAYSGRNGQQT